MDLIEKHCFAKAVIKFESIFIGNKISLQIKLYECEVKMIDSGRKKLLPRPAASSTVNIVVKSNTYNPLDEDEDDDDNDTFDIDDAGSLKDGDTAVEKKDEEDVVVLEEKVETLEIKEEEVRKTKKKIVKILKK